MKAIRTLLLVFALFLPTSGLRAHIGSPNVFFESSAGPYPVRIIVRPPPVIPGLAEVFVRVPTNGIERVTALPIRWNTGKEGAPPPDEARPVRGETNLFSTQIWFMQGGAQSVEVEISGPNGTGSVIVPVNAVATRVLEMSRVLGVLLSLAGLVLFALFVSIIGTAVRESVLAPGQAPGRKLRWIARAAMLLAATLAVSLLWLGKQWWDAEERDYQSNRLYQALETRAEIRSEAGQHFLGLELTDEKFLRGPPLVPDHGKLMHLFLIREPGLDAFAHLHPEKLNWKNFQSPLPNLPGGEYRVYADITYETGLSDTLTTTITLPDEPSEGNGLDPDDSWIVHTSLNTGPSSRMPETQVTLSQQLTMHWARPEALIEDRETELRFLVRDAAGEVVVLEPYMGMLAHLVLRREEGDVFTHLHPSGSFSMAAQQLFEMRLEGKAPLKVAKATEDPFCRLPGMDEILAGWQPGQQTITFPYAFPKPGRYRLWVQVKVAGRILTGVFDATVAGRG